MVYHFRQTYDNIRFSKQGGGGGGTNNMRFSKQGGGGVGSGERYKEIFRREETGQSTKSTRISNTWHIVIVAFPLRQRTA